MQLAGVLRVTDNQLLRLRLLWEFEWANLQVGINLLVLNGLFVTLSPLLLHDEFHLPLCVFNYGGGNFDHAGWEMWRVSEGVFA